LKVASMDGAACRDGLPKLKRLLGLSAAG